MYDPESIARSLRRYLSNMLAQPWNVALQRQEVRDDARPMGAIELGEEKERRARSSVPQGERENFLPVTISLYPPLGDPPVAGGEARRLAGRLRDLFQVGGDGVTFADGRRACGPHRVPLWDYEGVARGEAGPQAPHDVLWVEDMSTRAIQDPLDARRWTVTADMRLSYEAPGRIGGPAVPLTGGVVLVSPDDPGAADAAGYVTGRGVA